MVTVELFSSFLSVVYSESKRYVSHLEVVIPQDVPHSLQMSPALDILLQENSAVISIRPYWVSSKNKANCHRAFRGYKPVK